MSTKSIICLFSAEVDDRNTLDAAFNLVKSCRGALQVVHVAAPPILYETLVEAGYDPAGDEIQTAGILEPRAHEAMAAALKYVTERAREHSVPMVSRSHPAVAGLVQVSFRTVIGPVSDCLPRVGRSVDLIVVGQDNSSGGDLEPVLTALFKTGSLVLTIPRHSHATRSTMGSPHTVVVAWDGSLTASRALRTALSYLVGAERVYLVSVEGMDDRQDAAGDADILSYLTVHGVSAELIHRERVGHGIGHLLLEKANDLGADLLIMGAYGHGHIGEMILGGVSSHILKHANLPLLLSH